MSSSERASLCQGILMVAMVISNMDCRKSSQGCDEYIGTATPNPMEKTEGSEMSLEEDKGDGGRSRLVAIGRSTVTMELTVVAEEEEGRWELLLWGGSEGEEEMRPQKDMPRFLFLRFIFCDQMREIEMER